MDYPYFSLSLLTGLQKYSEELMTITIQIYSFIFWHITCEHPTGLPKHYD